MAKQLNVNLSFTADTKQAQTQLRDLQLQLSKLTTNAGSSPLGLTKEISSAIVEIGKLQAALSKATTSTGSLDLGKFRTELKTANLDAQKIATTLSSLGPQGQAAFAQIAQAVSTAEIPIRKVNGLLTEFATTLKNTVRWQLSSSIVHGFMGTIQGAYGYAQDLNESLNDIRIVTGQSVDEMAAFAREANKAAKELSTTTTAYTDASLIFYQQGLSGSDVTDRADIVIKLANVSKQSAEDVSSSMTAIWNNFYDGSKSLEYYADVITALGASTASSSAEISEGLEKFAAIGETVGLSYEYATASLAAVVANTRQSADVVGTAFKTIFARLQGLNLGETLEDGVDLNKYSEALQKVGVSVFDLNGELKDADAILKETATRWDTLTKAEQIALAQTVAGTRQYAQFMAIMEGWDDIEQNLDTIAKASGTLEEQQEIFEEGWEGASKRLKAALQEIYTQLLDDNFFIGLTNAFTKVVESISNIIDALGGLKGIIPLISGMLFKMFGPDLTTSIDNFVLKIQEGSKKGQEAIIAERKTFNQSLIDLKDDGTAIGAAMVDVYSQQGASQNALIEKTRELQSANKDITATEQEQLNILMDISSQLGQEYIADIQNLEVLKQKTEELKQQALSQVSKVDSDSGLTQAELQKNIETVEQLQIAYETVTKLKNEFFSAAESQGNAGAQEALRKIYEELDSIAPLSEETRAEVVNLFKEFEKLGEVPIDKVDEQFVRLEEELAKLGGISISAFEDLIDSIDGTDAKSKRLKVTLEQLLKNFNSTGSAMAKAAKDSNNYRESISNLNERIKTLDGTTASLGERISTIGYAMSSFAMAVNSIKGIIDTINNPDLSGWERFIAIVGSVGMTLPMVISSFTRLNQVMGTTSATATIFNAIFGRNVVITDAMIASQTAKNLQDTLSIAKTKILTAEVLKQVAAEKLEISAKNKEKIVEMLMNTERAKSIGLTEAQARSIAEEIITLKTRNDTISKATILQNAFNTSLLANPFTWVVAGLAAITLGLSAYSKHLEEAKQKQRELNEEEYNNAKNAHETAKEESEKTQELYKSYINAKSMLDDTEESKQRLKTATEDLCDALGVEWNILDKLQGKYEGVNKAILEQQKAKIQETIEAAQNTLNTGQGRIEDVVDEAIGEYDFGYSPVIYSDGSIGDYKISANIETGISDDDDEKKILDAFVEYMKTNYSDIYDAEDSYNANFSGKAVRFYEGVDEKEAIDALRSFYEYISKKENKEELGITKAYMDDSEAYTWFKELYNASDVTDILNDLNEAESTIESSIAQLADIEAQLYNADNDPSNITNEEEFEQYKQNYISQLKNTMEKYGIDAKQYTDEYFDELANQYLLGFDNLNSIIEKVTLKSAIAKKLPDNNDVEEFLDQVEAAGNLELLATIVVDENSSLEKIKTQYNKIVAEAELADIQVQLTTVQSAQDTIGEGKILDDDQQRALKESFPEFDWDTFNLSDPIDQLQQLSDLTQNLIDKNNQYYNLVQDTTQKNRENQAQLEEDIENTIKAYEDAKQAVSDWWDEHPKLNEVGIEEGTAEEQAEIQALDDEVGRLYAKLLDLQQQDYSVEFDINWDETFLNSFSAAVNSIVSESERLQNAAELIGEGFIVAKENVHALAEVYPELLENATVYEDGRAKLDQAAVQTIMKGNSSLIKSNSDVTAESLEGQLTLLDAEIAFYEAKLDLLNKSLNNEIDYNDAKSQIATNEKKLEETLENAMQETVTQGAQNEIDNNKISTQISLDNFDTIDQRIAEISQHYSKMLSGNVIVATKSGSAIGGSASSYTPASNVSDVEEIDNSVYMDEIRQQIKSTQETLDTLYDQRADYTALLSDLKSGTNDAIDAMNRVANGQPGKLDKNSGGGKAQEHKTKDKVQKFEADPFNKVNQELEDIEHNLNMIDKQQSHMFGKELINNLKQQNAQLKRQTELHREKLAIAQREANVLRSQLQAEGVAFDGDNIANYNAMLQAAENQINALIDQYNALSAAEQEAWDKAAKDGNDPIKQAEKYYEELKNQMDKYTDYMSTVYSEEEAIQDALFQQIENNLKAYEVEIELKLDMSEARRAMNKFLKDISTDIKNMYKTSAEWATTFRTSEKDAGTYKDDASTKLKQLEDYKNASVGGADDMFATESEKYKAITDLEKEILEDSENLLNEYQTAYDNLRDSFGEVADQFNEILDQFDIINDTLDHYAKVIELLYGGETDNGREQLAEVYSLQKENSLARQDAMRKWGDELQRRRADAIAKGYDEDDSYIKDIDAQIEENSKNLESEIENYIDTIQKELENSIKMAQSQMDKSIWGTSIADTRQEWDDKKAMADGYYDSVEKIYQLESLESKWKAAITNTSSLKAQQQLAAIMDKQVASLESKNALSEKDIELAEKELAVYQAQIALEEAQNNKNSMKLTRDAAGNWSYQYVADEDDIEDKQQGYLDKTNEWRTASINAAEEITERIMDVYETFSERMTEIMNDVTLSEEEKDAKIAKLNETYLGEDSIITKLVEDSNYIQSTSNRATYIELAGLYKADKANLERMTEAEKALIENMNAAGVLSYEGLKDYVIGDDGQSGIYGEIYNLCKQTNEDSSAAWKSMAADAINRMYKDPDSVSNIVKQAYTDMGDALKIYNKAIEDSVEASGIEWSKVSLQFDEVQQKIGDTANKIDDITGKLGDLSAFEDAVLRMKEMWDETAGSIRQATSDLQNYLNLLANFNGGSGGGDTSSGEGSTGGGGTSGGNTGGGSAGSGSGGDGNLTVGETVTYTGGLYYEDSYGNGKTGSRGPGKKVKVTQIKDGRPYPIHVMSSDSAYGWLTKGQLSGYDTGGYTGDWAGGDGRLALLHHKELVLNKEDTENILNAVNMVRELNISSILSSIDDNIKNGLSNLIGGLLGLCTKTFNGAIGENQNSTNNTTINVEAVFPSANSVEDIREAILSLPNYASQIKMRK